VRSVRIALVLLGLGFTAVPFAPGVVADEPPTLTTAEVEAFAVRVEYDIPLPLSPGTIPHVVGEIRASRAGENAKGLSGAPTHFDAVVGGTYYDPDKENKGEENLPPQTECFYPGDLLDTDFRFPTETKAETEGLPPTSYATARCGAGPEVELHAVGAGDAPSATVAAATAHGLARPREGVIEGTAAARAIEVSIAAGAITVGAIEVSGHSEVTGSAGGEATVARVTLTDVVAGGTRFSIANDRILVGDQEIPLASEEAQAFADSLNAGLESSRCRVDLLTNPSRYPQGFLLSRKEPRVGLGEDGSFAASMKAGLLVLCDLPDELGTGTDFKPQRLQAVLGFAYTSASAQEEPGGFGLGNLGGDGGEIVVPTETAVAGLEVAAPAAATPDLAPAVAPEAAQTVEPARSARRAPAPLAGFAMDPATRWTVGLVSIVVWVLLTHAAARKLRGVFS
jgi:hypothetical protein